jgi:WD40 repeat protein
VAQEQPPKKDPRPAVDLRGNPLPEGAVARMGQDRWLHQDAHFAAFLPDGKRVITVSADQSIRVWEFPSGKEVRRIAEPKDGGRMPVAALSGDGRTIATFFVPLTAPVEYEINLHVVATGKQLPSLPTTPGQVVAMAFSPQGDHLAVRLFNGTIQVWDWAKAKEVCKIPRGEAPASGLDLAYAPKTNLIATTHGSLGASDRVVRLWDAGTGVEKKPIPTNIAADTGLSVVFAPDGKTLAESTSKVVQILDVASGKPIRQLTAGMLPEPPKKGSFAGLAVAPRVVFSSNGKKLYALSDLDGPQVCEWNVATGELHRKCPVSTHAIHNGKGVSLSPDESTLILMGCGPQFFDLRGKEIKAINRPAASMQVLHFASDGKTLLTQSRPGQVEKWDVLTGKELGNLPIQLPAMPKDEIHGLIDETGKVTPIKRPAMRGKTVISPDGRVGVHFNTGTRQPAVLFDTATGKELAKMAPTFEIAPSRFHPVELDSFVFSPDSKMLAGCGRTERGKVYLYEVPSGKPLHTVATGPRFPPRQPKEGFPRGDPGAARLFVSPDGKMLASFGVSQIVWDTATGRRLGELAIPHNVAVSAHAAFSPDGRCLVVEMNDKSAAVYELASAQVRHTFGMKQPPPEEASTGVGPLLPQPAGSRLAFSPNGNSLAHGNRAGMVHVWDIVTGKELAAFKGHTAAVNAIAFSANGKTVASASEDSTALMWDIAKLKRPTLPAKALTPDDLDKCWQALGESNAEKAFDAIRDLVVAPRDSIPFLKDRLKPASPLDMKFIEQLFGQLDDPEFKVRDRAARELLNLDQRLVLAIDKALAASPPLQTKKRLEDLRSQVTGMLLYGETLRAFRAVEVLELIGTRESRQFLQALAEGARNALLTTSAKAALQR